VNQLDFDNKYSYYDWIDIPHGTRGAIAKYRNFHQGEYNDNSYPHNSIGLDHYRGIKLKVENQIFSSFFVKRKISVI